MSAIGLSGKRVVITGAARGLGRAYAEACCAAGATVAVADILEKEGRETAESLRGKGHEALFVPVDLADAKSVDAMGETLGKEWGRIDGLVNNGALATKLGGKRFENIDVAVWDQVMAVNVRGVWLATKACLPWIRKSEHGKIVNISSDTALFGSDFLLRAGHDSGGGNIGGARGASSKIRPGPVHQTPPATRRSGRNGDLPPVRRRELHDRPATGGQWRLRTPLTDRAACAGRSRKTTVSARALEIGHDQREYRRLNERHRPGARKTGQRAEPEGGGCDE